MHDLARKHLHLGFSQGKREIALRAAFRADLLALPRIVDVRTVWCEHDILLAWYPATVRDRARTERRQTA